MCSCVNEYQSMDHILFHCDNTREQRETMIQHIGMWPTSKQNLINKHQKIFSQFVKSIDFDDMQQSAQSAMNNTNNKGIHVNKL
jgi:hypothetical protein